MKDAAREPGRAKGAAVPWGGLADSWQAASLAAGWRHPADWCLAPIEAAVREFSHNGSLSAATAAELGQARAEAGVGLREALADLDALYGTACRRADLDAVAALAEAWAMAGQEQPGLGCLDTATGLHSMTHFEHRLREILASPEQCEAGFLQARFSYRVRSSATEARLSWALLADLGSCITATLGADVCAAHTGGMVAALLPDLPGSRQRLEACRDALESLRSGTLNPVLLTVSAVAAEKS
ncbi:MULTISPECIES: hypothetical protein [Arthrobacter]|uniref:DUF222 domain-containing protein n=2 Tax=Arthrobacter TaxID=1663 RepID=A0ABU9KHV8_9MICC|nr:hypothetical protein [Arthrobacter sp. YJM1]MDP5226576.1 hypothetical protein [Arthrobacter sp. YJM1]